MKVLFLLIWMPTAVATVYLISVFGTLGMCGLTACLGGVAPTGIESLLSVAVIIISFLPACAAVLLLHALFFRSGRPRRSAAAFIWAISVLLGLLGAFAVAVDPGDANWAGWMLLATSILLVLSHLCLRLTKQAP